MKIGSRFSVLARCPFSPLLFFFAEGSPTTIDRKKLVPTYSTLTTGGPSFSDFGVVVAQDLHF